jgi:glycosyltransferase involved in cell wall biosynthesis
VRIAILAPLVEPVPPPLYGGTERVVSLLTEELVRRGHDVTLFAYVVVDVRVKDQISTRSPGAAPPQAAHRLVRADRAPVIRGHRGLLD